MPVLTKLKTKSTATKTVQKFVRVNIDSRLDKILNQYSQDYPLFSNSDIIRMLISRGIRRNQLQSFKTILSGNTFIDMNDNEDSQYQWLVDNGLDRKSN
jgi:hypothetical protein